MVGVSMEAVGVDTTTAPTISSVTEMEVLHGLGEGVNGASGVDPNLAASIS